MRKTIKKDFFAPWSKGLGATRRAAMLLLVMMLTTATAWATDKTLSGSESYTAPSFLIRKGVNSLKERGANSLNKKVASFLNRKGTPPF